MCVLEKECLSNGNNFYSRKRKQFCPKVNDCSKIKDKDKTKDKGIMIVAESVCVAEGSWKRNLKKEILSIVKLRLE